jgi:cytoskeletal protein CcmA (bactofilin family)
MRRVTCAVCGAKKGEANRWWVLFQTDSNQAVLIGRMEEAETLSQSREETARFDLCGEACLYRKLSGILERAIDGPAKEARPAQTSSQPIVAGGHESNSNPTLSKGGNAPEDSSALRQSKRHTLRQILRLGRHVERIAHESAPSSVNLRVWTSQKILSTRLGDAAAIAESLRITGRILSRGSLYVNGDVAGTIELPDYRLTVGPSAKIRAVVSAKEIEIFGVMEGEVRADKVIVRKNATLVGDVCTRALMIEDGAWFEGSSSMRGTARGALQSAQLSVFLSGEIRRT